MPRLINTITSYFFKKQRDLYFVRFTQVDRSGFMGMPKNCVPSQIPGRKELLTWLKENMPHVEVGPIYTFTSESGFIVAPYDGSLYVDFSEEDAQKYADVWENPDTSCKDPRWQCYFYPLEQYKEKYGGRTPDPTEFYDEF